jgi:hypothetical protein
LGVSQRTSGLCFRRAEPALGMVSSAESSPHSHHLWNLQILHLSVSEKDVVGLFKNLTRKSKSFKWQLNRLVGRFPLVFKLVWAWTPGRVPTGVR